MMVIPLILQRQACAGAQCIYSYCHETSAGAGYRAMAQKRRMIMTMHTAIKLPAQNLEPKAFAPYGEIIRPCTSSAETAVEEPKLTLTNGTPRLWIMDLKRRGLVFAEIARHRRVSQCLGSMQGKEWFIGVAPPNDLADGTRPELDRIAAFRIPGDCLIKLHVGTWHAGPHFVHDECLFFNLENLDTNDRDFDKSDLPNEYQIQA